MDNKAVRKRVLIVDDDHDLVKGLGIYLGFAGLDVSSAFGGVNALRELDSERPSAVILDILMPDLDGVQVCRHIREKLRDGKTPVIILSAVSDSKAKREVLEAGATEYLTKPCDFGRVYKTVARHIA